MDKSASQPSLSTLIRTRLSRREVLRAGAKLGIATASMSALGGLSACSSLQSPRLTPLGFQEIEKSRSTTHHIAQGYDVHVLAGWGDALTSSQAAFAPLSLTAQEQEQRIGQNCDYTAFMPLPKGSHNADHGILHINHEYTINRLMFPQSVLEDAQHDTHRIAIEQAAQGFSTVEIKKTGGTWQVVKDSPYNRRITANSKIPFSGPAAGHVRLHSVSCKHGKHAKGTFGNCAGGVTPWGTVLTCEENIDTYFVHLKKDNPEYRNHKRMRVDDKPEYDWFKADARFDVSKHPNEPNHFGWVVEYDPYDPSKSPIKRTALGRFKHECATTVLTSDGRVAVYSGDDEIYQYIYRYVSRDKFIAGDDAHNATLLDNGILSVARFYDDGSAEWIPLQFGCTHLTPENGFHSQADVLIDTRTAADLVGATPLDRPEDIEVHPTTGKVYVSLTKNKKRAATATNKANPRGPNPYGHILELTPHDHNHADSRFAWDVFIQAGDPAVQGDAAQYHPSTSANGWLTNPDNLAFDPAGHLWICTDGLPETKHYNDGLFATHTEGEQRALTKLFFTAPTGAEITGPSFTPDGKTLFLSVQHPADDEYFQSTFDHPTTRWPDFNPALPPRSCVVAITKADGGEIGS